MIIDEIALDLISSASIMFLRIAAIPLEILPEFSATLIIKTSLSGISPVKASVSDELLFILSLINSMDLIKFLS
ncbi:Uncharacterised protein [Vibrio cholerae]|uniref:Uncharacterized protein n=1 Tax=Vibrio cholerae TaxID=666 RepID=A0A656AIH3_VIBCL|nr:Uncharacterised protein [Vibrio cholerae]CSD12373.1 Uncharacterised protein [Vibrio cholerae]